MQEKDQELRDEFHEDCDFAITWFVFGTLSLFVNIAIIVIKRNQLRSMRIVYWQILAFNLAYSATISIVLYYRCNKDLDGLMPKEDPIWPYALYSLLYGIEKLTLLLANWTFSYKYWIVSLTLKQALSDENETNFAFDERFQKKLFVGITLLAVLGSILDSILFYIEESQDKEKLARASDITFVSNGLSLSVSLGFLIAAICRISSLLKQFGGIKISEKHMSLHVTFLVINVLLTLTLTLQFLLSYAEAQITEYISVFYFCAQPLSMTMMLVVISSMSQNMNEGRQVSLYVDGQGRYRFL